jgi:hypothetical protein
MAKKETVVEGEVVESAVAEQASTAIVSWEDRLAAYATEAAAEEEMFGGKFLSLKAGRLSIDSIPCAGNKLDVIVVAYTTEYALYEGKYDPNNPQPPVCYAFGKDEQQMEPHEKAAKPQHTDCATCPKNEWGSDPEGGKGKACKNTRRLGFIPADSINDPSKIKDAEEVFVKLPVMSAKNWAKYVNDTNAQYKRPPFGVLTSMTTEPDAKSQFKVVFKSIGRIESQEAMMALIDRHEASQKTIGFPYSAAQEKAPVKESDKF